MGVAGSIQQDRPSVGVDGRLDWHGSVTYAIGIDAGATTISGGVVDVATGTVVRRVSSPSVRADAAALDACVELAGELASTHPVELIGIAVPEIVRRGGSIESADNWDWRTLDVPGAFRSIGVAALQSDVRAAAFGEARVGAGRGLECFLYVIVDTGISAVVVRHGVPWDGRCGAALILGVPPVEEVAGGKAFAAVAGNDGRDALTNPRHADLVARAASRLGEEVARAVNLTDPDAVIVGGSLGLHPGYRRQWVEVMRRSIWYRPTALVPVVASELEADAVLVGAALAAATVVPV
jgi:predicted NBD/HSP70 family sugar kinase